MTSSGETIVSCIEQFRKFTVFRDGRIAAAYTPVTDGWMAHVFEGLPSAQLTGDRLKATLYDDGRVALSLDRTGTSNHIDFVVHADDMVVAA